MLEPWVVGEHHADTVAGCLYDTGRGYPAATFSSEEAPDSETTPDSDPSTGGVVHGMVVTLDPHRAAEALNALDRYEGPEYARITVRTGSGTHVSTYAWVARLHDCREVPGGRWAHDPQPETRPPSGR